MQNCMKHLMCEYGDAKEYYELAITEEGRCKSIYRDLACSELEHLEKLVDVYKIKHEGKTDLWLEFFKDEATLLKDKLRQL